jgi:hypothetical protein
VAFTSAEHDSLPRRASNMLAVRIGQLTAGDSHPIRLAALLATPLSACFSTTLWVGWRGAQTAPSHEPSAVSGAVCQRRSVRGLLRRLPLARGLCLSQVRSCACLRPGWPSSVAMRLLPLPGLADGRDCSSQLEDPAFQPLLGLGSGQGPTSYKQIRHGGAVPPR